jgi:hypothetical protein
MESEQPLVEFLATVKVAHKTNSFGDWRYGKKIDRDPEQASNAFQVLNVTLVLNEAEDIRAFDDYASGPMGLKRVAFRVLSEATFKRQDCDPNQEPDDKEDELSLLRRSYVRLMQSHEPPQPDAATS